MPKVIDIYKEIEDDGDYLELKFGNKSFKVYDIPLDVFIQVAQGTQDVNIMVKRLASMFQTTEAEIRETVGLRGSIIAIRHALDWIQNNPRIGVASDKKEVDPTSGNEQ